MKITIPEGRECNHPLCNETCRKKKEKPKKTYQLKRTPLQKKPYKIKKSSTKRAEQIKRYIHEDKPEYLSQHPFCELGPPIEKFRREYEGNGVKWWPICTLKAVEIHHPSGKENKLLNDKNNMKAACDSNKNKKSCHCWATEYSKEAIEIGISYSRHSK